MGRVVGPGQAQWTADDVDLALEWQAEQGMRHHACGHPLDETSDTDAEGTYTVRKFRCWACYATEKAAAEAAQSATTERYGLIFVATRDDDDGVEAAGDD